MDDVAALTDTVAALTDTVADNFADLSQKLDQV